MDPLKIIETYYTPGSKAHYVLLHHSMMVSEKAIGIAGRIRDYRPDRDFIREAAMLHDIGICMTNEPGIGCFGGRQYICHGYLGRELLEKEGLPRHALVCERHIGVGISLRDIQEKKLPLPHRDMVPVSIEEQIVCFADKFFSKNPEFLLKEKPLERVREGIAIYGDEKLRVFDAWLRRFGNQ